MKRTSSRIIAIVLVIVLMMSSMAGCADIDKGVISDNESSEHKPTNTAPTEFPANTATIPDEGQASTEIADFLAYEKVFSEYALAYDTFDASVILPDGTEVFGIGYSDFSCYFESEDGSKGFFPAGFIVDGGDVVISEDVVAQGLVVENLDDFSDDYGFVLAYKTDPFLEHCVIDGKYVQYGIDEYGKLCSKQRDYSKEIVDTSLGALYSYDENRFLYDPNVGEFIPISGESLYANVDFNELETRINQILETQDYNYSKAEVQTSVYFAQDAVNSYLLSLQEETFLGCDVAELIEEVAKLDPMQCVRFTPEGHVVIDIERNIPQGSSALAKWTVGICCGIVVAGSIAVNVFVPATTPVTGAICGAAIDVFMQVVLENKEVENINWTKVAVSSVAGALMAWACPLGASTITNTVAGKTGSAVLSKLAGYGFLTISNSIVSGATNAAFTMIDEGSSEEIFDSFLFGAVLGACCTIGASALSEAGHAAMNALQKARPENWLVKLSDGAKTFIGNHQVKLFSESVENILNPKSVYEASKAGIEEYNRQYTLTNGKRGGSYSEVKKNSVGKYTEVHEMPSRESTGVPYRDKGPSIKMTKEDHRLTASYCRSREADLYRAEQKRLIEMGNYHDAIQMDIDDIHEKFGDKYDEAIKEMLEYAASIGWW